MKVFGVFLFLVIFTIFEPSLAQDRCDALSLETVDLQLLFDNSPYVDHYSLDVLFNCTEQVFSHPARGTSGYDGTAVVVQNSQAIVYQFIVSADQKSADSVVCGNGVAQTWRFLKFQLTSNGGYFCIFVCTADGADFEEFLCLATDSSYFADETQALALVSGVSNAANIFDAYSSCPAPQNCAIFR